MYYPRFLHELKEMLKLRSNQIKGCKPNSETKKIMVQEPSVYVRREKMISLVKKIQTKGRFIMDFMSPIQ